MDKTELKIFHIAGITELYKNDLIGRLKKLKMYIIFDLDTETEKIYKLKDIQSKLKELNKTGDSVYNTNEKPLYDATIFSGILWTILASSVLFYTFTKL